MIWVVSILLIGLLAWLALRWYARADPALVKRGMAGFALLFLGLIVAALVLTGRGTAALPFLLGSFFAYQRLRSGLGVAAFIRRLWNASQGRGGMLGESQLETPSLTMTLDKRTGAVSGTLLIGRYKGQNLSQLKAGELLTAYNEVCAVDRQGARLLETYLDRTIGPAWRSHVHSSADQGNAGSPLTPARAAEILGVEIDAPPKAIAQAHKRLMKIAHPDQGGSDYLAQQINAAKDILLKS